MTRKSAERLDKYQWYDIAAEQLSTCIQLEWIPLILRVETNLTLIGTPLSRTLAETGWLHRSNLRFESSLDRGLIKRMFNIWILAFSSLLAYSIRPVPLYLVTDPQFSQNFATDFVRTLKSGLSLFEIEQIFIFIRQK